MTTTALTCKHLLHAQDCSKHFVHMKTFKLHHSLLEEVLEVQKLSYKMLGNFFHITDRVRVGS